MHLVLSLVATLLLWHKGVYPPFPPTLKILMIICPLFPSTTIPLLTFPETSSVYVPFHSNQTPQQLLPLINTAAAGFGWRHLSWYRTADPRLRGTTSTLHVCVFKFELFQVINTNSERKAVALTSISPLIHTVKWLFNKHKGGHLWPYSPACPSCGFLWHDPFKSIEYFMQVYNNDDK